MVITKGAGASQKWPPGFTLDAMPGKQMSIDADLNAGIIDETEARRRRAEISREADFYGAMDGASKFVRGEAVAGILIILVNIGGGFIIGVFQQDLPFLTAAQTYTILTIGDALVAQIPALIISTAAGIIVSRAASEDEHGKGIRAAVQGPTPGDGPLRRDPVCYGTHSRACPTFPSSSLSLVVGGVAYFTLQESRRWPRRKAEETQKQFRPLRRKWPNPFCIWIAWNWKWDMD